MSYTLGPLYLLDAAHKQPISDAYNFTVTIIEAVFYRYNCIDRVLLGPQE